MKRILMYICFALSYICVNAQSYFMPTENTSNNLPDLWNCVTIECDSFENVGVVYPYFSYKTYFIENDSTDNCYKKLYYVNVELFRSEDILEIVGHVQDEWVEKNKKYMGDIRYSENNKQIYYRVNNQEYLLFDFSLEIGDTCRVYPYIDTIVDNDINEINLIVSDIYYKNGVKYFDLQDDVNLKTTSWIDGIGSLYGISPMPLEKTSCDIGQLLICAWYESTTLYSMEYDALQKYIPNSYVGCPHIVITGIDNIYQKSTFDRNSYMYNILGQPINDNYKGIVIKNGQKVLKQ